MNNTPHPREIHGIKGLSERRRLPRLGKIRLGVKKTNSGGAEYPTEVDYFVCPPEVQRVYGAHPKSLRIMIPLEDSSQVFPQAYKWYGSGSGLKCKGDGRIALRRWTDIEPSLQTKIGSAHEANDLIEIPCPCSRLKSGECGVKGHLMVLLPDVSLSGIYQIDTGSANNLVEINSAIDFLRALLGRIALIPLTLRREPVEITYQGKRRIHYLLKLTWEGDLHAAQQIRNTTTTTALPALVLPIPSDEGVGLNEDIIADIAPPFPLPTVSAPTSTSPPPLPTAAPVPAPPVTPQSTTAAEPLASPTPSDPETSTPVTPPTTPPAAQTDPTPTTPIASVPKTAATEEPKLPKSSSPPLQCGCGATVTANVADYSQRYFKEVICLNCQKKRFGKVSGSKK